jgi:phosphonate transport system substrate-binding protein
MLKRLLKPVIAASVLATSILGNALAETMDTLNFGIISTESSQNLKTVWDPFLQDMEKKLGKTVKPFFAPDYAGIIQGMRFDKVDVAWYGNKSAMEAVDRAGGEIFAQTVDAGGNPGYWSLLVAHKNSPLNSVEDMLAQSKDLVFGNGDPNSTSGFLVPTYYVFATNNVDPKKAFKRVLNSSHEVNLLAVSSKQVDVATNNTENMSRFQITNPDKAADIKIIWKSPLIPSDPIVWRKNLPESVKGEIYEFFMNYGKSGDAAELKTLQALQWAPFRPSSDDQLLPIRQLALYTEKQKVENDDKLSAADKELKIAEFDAQLAGLERRLAALDARQ